MNTFGYKSLEDRLGYHPNNNEHPQLVLHIGAEKTGSTSVQHYCVQMAPLLACGVRYPLDDELPATYRGNHMGLSLASGAPWSWHYDLGARFGCEGLSKFRKSFLQSLDNIISQRQTEGEWTTLFLSNEHLSSQLRFVDVQTLCSSLLSRFSSIKVVLVCRDPFDAQLSKWTTNIRNGGVMSLYSWLDREFYSPGYDYANIAAMWRACGCSVVIIDYSERAIGEIFAALGITLYEEYAKSDKENVSPGLVSTEILRISNILKLRRVDILRRLTAVLTKWLDNLLSMALQRRLMTSIFARGNLASRYKSLNTDYISFLKQGGLR